MNTTIPVAILLTVALRAASAGHLLLAYALGLIIVILVGVEEFW